VSTQLSAARRQVLERLLRAQPAALRDAIALAGEGLQQPLEIESAARIWIGGSASWCAMH
jgi:hypothetical protein